MNVGLAAVLFVHILGGTVWLGGSVFANIILVPYIAARPVNEQRQLVGKLLIGPERLMVAGAVTASVFGLLLGIASGRI